MAWSLVQTVPLAGLNGGQEWLNIGGEGNALSAHDW
jgi:hypothetical protein